MNALIEEKLKLLPSSPGVYKMYNSSGEVIYVGKAVSLKNRVRQYFQSSRNHTPKVIAMVQHIADFDTIQVTNETEALSLESNLIKEFKPKYNILLKDDKHFPYVRIDLKQDFPRFEVVHRIQNDGAKYLGPYLSSYDLRSSMNIIREYFPVRHCKKDLNKAIAKRERPCLMFHVGKCCAPCSGNVSRESYHEMLNRIISFLNGDTNEVLNLLKKDMSEAAEALEYERAAKIRDSIQAIEAIGSKQSVIKTNHAVSDVFAVGRLDDHVLVFALYVREGKVIGTNRFRMEADEDDDSTVMSAFLKQYYLESEIIPNEILLYNVPDELHEISEWLNAKAGRRIHLYRPLRGDKVRLTELCYRNCVDLLEKDATLQKRSWERGEGSLIQLADFLQLKEKPVRMECFDNSHIRGTDTVSAMIVFKNGQPDKTAYRRFKIRSEAGGDDLIAMREALSRRFEHAYNGDPGFTELPDLLVVDGGPTQLSVASEVLDAYGFSYIPVIGLAEQHELIYRTYEDEPLCLPRSSGALHLLERLRDEAHRFAISYHRSLHEKNMLFSELDKIPGIGEIRKRALFDTFITFDRIKTASLEELSNVRGMSSSSAKAVYSYFHAEAENSFD